MTNEEKARELAIYFGREIDAQGKACYDIGYEVACSKMAEWKDDKFFTILACIKFSLEKQGIGGADKFIEDIQKEWEK